VGNVNKTDNPTVNRAGFSFDGGSNWFQASSEPPGTNGGGTVAAAADASRVLWSPPGATPSFSTNNGSSWTASTGLPSGAVVGADRVNPMKFYGFANGTFYVSGNGGATFTAATTTGLPATAQFKAVPGHEGDVWLAGGSTTGAYGVWHSTNNGTTFTRNAGLEEADNIGLGLAASGQTYPALYSSAQAGGVRGIYRSTDAGASWTRVNDDQHQFASTGGAITGDPRVFGRVYLSTNGLGIVYGEPSGSTTPDFTVAAAPNSLVVNRGASGTSTITITRTAGFAGSVAFTASGLPTGVTAAFNPTSTTGASTMLTLSASATATAGSSTVTVTGASGTLTHTATIALTVSGGGGGNGGVTPTAVVTSASPWFNEEQLRLDNTGTLTALTVTIVVQRTTGISFSNQYNTVGGQITQASSSTAAAVTYTFTLAAGQTLPMGNGRTFAAQTSGTGTAHPTAGDTFTVTYTTGGTTFTQSGHF
jgi:xyloglucan-specific exo-beta-1,4-glucanase